MVVVTQLLLAYYLNSIYFKKDEILINKKINDHNTKSLSENLTYVLQETILLHYTT